jgi:hypothetical protein
VGEEVSKYKNTPLSSNAAVERMFSEPRFFLLMTIADSPLLGQSASGQNFYDHRGRFDNLIIKSDNLFLV